MHAGIADTNDSSHACACSSSGKASAPPGQQRPAAGGAARHRQVQQRGAGYQEQVHAHIASGRPHALPSLLLPPGSCGLLLLCTSFLGWGTSFLAGGLLAGSSLVVPVPPVAAARAQHCTSSTTGRAGCAAAPCWISHAALCPPPPTPSIPCSDLPPCPLSQQPQSNLPPCPLRQQPQLQHCASCGSLQPSHLARWRRRGPLPPARRRRAPRSWPRAHTAWSSAGWAPRCTAGTQHLLVSSRLGRTSQRGGAWQSSSCGVDWRWNGPARGMAGRRGVLQPGWRSPGRGSAGRTC